MKHPARELQPLRLRLPATSANLGPAFDTAGLALDLWIEIEATPSETDCIEASGRDRDLVGRLENNLVLETYRSLAPAGPALYLRVRNDIPLGMGCGSSAAALLAGVALANHFGRLGWTSNQMRDEACRLEAHPDNVAACSGGGLTVSSMDDGGKVEAASFGAQLAWRCLLVLPRETLSTSVARGLLPATYPRADVVRNLQTTALLVAAFALGRADLLTIATEDRLHQPYRASVCPLLQRLLPLRGQHGILSVTLSGAGPATLCLLDNSADEQEVRRQVLARAGELSPELLLTCVACGATLTPEDVVAG